MEQIVVFIHMLEGLGKFRIRYLILNPRKSCVRQLDEDTATFLTNVAFAFKNTYILKNGKFLLTKGKHLISKAY